MKTVYQAPAGLVPVTRAVQDDLELWTADEVARLLKCSTTCVYRLARRQEIPCVHIGGLVRFRPTQIRALLEAK
jgi:excisionase family DNA binding protein